MHSILFREAGLRAPVMQTPINMPPFLPNGAREIWLDVYSHDYFAYGHLGQAQFIEAANRWRAESYVDQVHYSCSFSLDYLWLVYPVRNPRCCNVRGHYTPDAIPVTRCRT